MRTVILISLLCFLAASCNDKDQAGNWLQTSHDALSDENAKLKRELKRLKSAAEGAHVPATKENLCRLVRIATRAGSRESALPIDEADLEWLRTEVNDQLRVPLDEAHGQEAVDIWIRDEVSAAFPR